MYEHAQGDPTTLPKAYERQPGEAAIDDAGQSHRTGGGPARSCMRVLGSEFVRV